MTRKFESPQAFRQALTDRLRGEAKKRNVPVETLRTKALIERLLARLFARADAPWLLKGGYTFELRYRPKARTTRDIDLTISGGSDTPLSKRLERVRDEMQTAAALDLGDFIQFRIGARRGELDGPPLGGATFPVEALIAGKLFGGFHLDVGFGDALIGEPEQLVGDDLFAFAHVEAARVVAIPKAQQFAEKIHAYTLPWRDRENTRVKDLVDLLLLIERGRLDSDELRTALEVTFETRKRHALPSALPLPPQSWVAEFRALAAEASVQPAELTAAFEQLNRFWNELMSSRG